MLYEKRALLARLDSKIAKIFGRMGLSANAWTNLSLVFGLATMYSLASLNYLMAAVFFALCAVCDIIDGNVARHKKTAGPGGAFYDTIIDRYVDFLVVMGLFLAGVPAIWLLLYLFGSMMTTYAKSAAAEKKVAKELRGGMLERGERLIIMFAGILLANFGRIYLDYTIIILAVLCNATAVQRIFRAMKNVQTGNSRKK